MTANPSRLNGRSITRKPQPLTSSNDSVRRSNTPSKLPEPRTPVGLHHNPSTLATRTQHLHPPQLQTPALTVKREIKSRLPRVAPTPNPQTAGSVLSTETRRLRAKKPPNPIPKSSTLPLPSSSVSSLSPRQSISRSTSNLGSSSSVDPDKTPQKPRLTRSRQGQARTQATLATNPHQHSADVSGKTLVPSVIEHLTPKRPMTRARSKHLLGLSSGTQMSSQEPLPPEQQPKPQPTGIPIAAQVKRKPSRVSQLAQVFQAQSETVEGTPLGPSSQLSRQKSPQTLLGLTPHRRQSDGSNSSLAVSPCGSMIANSPNISALAASLSKQFGQRDRLGRGRSSVSDMLRYSTMSTLGELRWEEEEVLLTDPNETEAMVADISMTKVTPLKSEVQSAAIALASARANFLSIVQENEMGIEGNNPGGPKDGSPAPAQHGSTKRRPSAGGVSNAATPLSPTHSSLASQSPVGRMLAHEAQLASLAASLEKSRQREAELVQEVKRLAEATKTRAESPVKMKRTLKEKMLGHHGPPKSKKAGADLEREAGLVEEITRLEAELEAANELNIELENARDLANHEHQESLLKLQSLADQNHALLSRPTIQDPPPSSNHTPAFDSFSECLQTHRANIQLDCDTLTLINLSLSISAQLFSSQQPDVLSTSP